MREKSSNKLNSRLNNYLTVFLCFIFIFSTNLTKAQNNLPDSTAVNELKEAAIYVSDGVSIYGSENVIHAKIVLLENNSGKNNQKKLIAKSSKTKKEKLLKLVSKEPKKYAIIRSDEALYNPFSPESSSHINYSKKSNSVTSSNNVQNFSKFQKSGVFSLNTNKKFVSQKTIFSYSQKRNFLNFSEIFSVRPPPIIS